ncbi:MAG: choice-of-anchor D domain-containing protein [Terriglobales bacterium]
MLRNFCLAMAVSVALLLTGCGGGTGINNSGSVVSQPPAPPNNGGGTQTLPNLSATSNLDFGGIFVGTTQDASVTLTNNSISSQTITVSQLNFTGADYALASNLSLPATVAAGQNLIVPVAFTPSTSGADDGTLVIVSDAADTNLTVSLSGAGVVTGALAYTPLALDFGSVTVGSRQNMSVILSNSPLNNANIDIGQVSLAGADLSLSSPPVLPATLTPGQTLTVTVTFSPSTGGANAGSLTISSNAPNNGVTLPISGYGLAANQLNASPTTLSFGNVSTGNNSSLTGELTAGTSTITVYSASITGSGFSLSGLDFPVTVSAGTSLPYTVTFAPTSSGEFNGTLSFTSSASNSPTIQNLNGTGTQNGGGSGGSGGGGTPSGAIAADFFNLDIGNFRSPWPNKLGVNIGVWRTLGAELRWRDIETCDGGSDPTNACYTWAAFDKWNAAAAANGESILFTTYYTPTWASSNPSGNCQDGNTGGCYPPNDVETGDYYWKGFLTALYTHTSTTPGLENIKYWECWNEPNVPSEYSDNNSDPAVALADLNTLCSDLHTTISTLDPTAKFTTPAPALGPGVVKWMTTWIADGYANYADYIAFHGYVCPGQGTCVLNSAETIVPIILTPLKALIASTKGTPNDVTGKPMWDTEGSDDSGGIPLTDPDQHAAFYARYTLVQQSAGIAHYSYWGYDFTAGIALVNNPGVPSATLNIAGIAWQQIYTWTVGWAFSTPCSNTSGSIWQCTLTNGTSTSLIVWDTSQTCSNGVCTTSNFTAPAGYSSYQDLAGNTNFIANNTVPIGAKPVRLQ